MTAAIRLEPRRKQDRVSARCVESVARRPRWVDRHPAGEAAWRWHRYKAGGVGPKQRRKYAGEGLLRGWSKVSASKAGRLLQQQLAQPESWLIAWDVETLTVGGPLATTWTAIVGRPPKVCFS